MDTIYETDIDWDAELRAELEEADELAEERWRYMAEVASCCQGRDRWCSHYGHGS
jgi:hypothetical protein